MKIAIVTVAIILCFVSCSPKLSPDSGWGNQRWVLIDMKGVPVQQSGTRRDAFLEFMPTEKKFTGNGGCNRINGSYSLEKKNTLRFGEVLSTKMSCEDINFENALVSTLAEVNRYESTGSTLLLKDDNKVLLIFESRSR
jgi:heat shock protein HslJ